METIAEEVEEEETDQNAQSDGNQKEPPEAEGHIGTQQEEITGDEG